MDALIKICEDELRKRRQQNPSLRGYELTPLPQTVLQTARPGVFWLRNTDPNAFIILRRVLTGITNGSPTPRYDLEITAILRYRTSTIALGRTVVVLNENLPTYEALDFNPFGYEFMDYGQIIPPPTQPRAVTQFTFEAYRVNYYTS